MASSGAKVDWEGARAPVSSRRGALTGTRPPRELLVRGGTPHVLALHGFGGTPYDVECVVNAAEDVGLEALAPVLPGHGTHARELSPLRFADFARGVDAALERLSGPVIAVGLSLGSLLVLDLALRRPDRVRALALLGNAVWLTAPYPRWALMLAERLRLPDFMAPRRGADIVDVVTRARHVGYDAHPVHAAIDVRRAGERLRGELGAIRAPTLVLHGAKDRVCPVANAWRVASALGSDDLRVIIFPRSAHILTCDVESKAVRAELAAFFRRFAKAPAEAQVPVEP
nr:MAG: hypothetical protein DIU78_25675 [Pseudomonadota bacterium]